MSVANAVAVGFWVCERSESKVLLFAVASETSLDAKRSVASKFFDWGCDAVQQARENPEAVRAFRAIEGSWCGGALDHRGRTSFGWFGVARIASANSILKPMLRRYAAAVRVPRLAAIWSALAR